MSNKTPFKSMTIPEHPSYLPAHLTIIVFESCVYCRKEIRDKRDWSHICHAGTQAHGKPTQHQKRIIVVDMRT